MEMKLFYLGEVAGMTKEQVEEAEKFIRGFEYGIVATNNPETGPRLSGLNNLAGQTLQQLHFATEASCQKLANLRLDPRCEVMYATMESGQVQIAGKAEIITDEALARLDERILTRRTDGRGHLYYPPHPGFYPGDDLLIPLPVT